MADVYRRRIRKPPNLSAEAAATLREGLSAAIERQKALASPYVLELTGTLQETEDSFYVEHEAAQAVPLSACFDEKAPPHPLDDLVEATRAVAHALAQAHLIKTPARFVHGGVSPGVLLRTEDDEWKITDFGFAPAICEALGVDSYLNLAIGPGENGDTGVWEVLPVDRDRDDRLCAFIDPERYFNKTQRPDSLRVFEPLSDINSAGIVLFALAELRHPYLQEDSERRNMGLTEMGFLVAFAPTIDRKDLLEAAEKNPLAQAWCELLPRMLDTLARNRPSAEEIVRKLDEFAPDPGKKIDRDLARARDYARTQRFDKARKFASKVRQTDGITPQQKAEAADILLEVEWRQLLTKITSAMADESGETWHDAVGFLAQLQSKLGIALSVPPAVQKQVESMRKALDAAQAMSGTLDGQESALEAAKTAPPAERLKKLLLFQKNMSGRVPVELQDVPAVAARYERIRDAIAAEAESVRAVVDRERAAEATAVKEWLRGLEQHLKTEKWAEVEQALNAAPALKYDAPSELAPATARAKAALERQRQLEADRKAATELLSKMKSASEAGQHAKVIELHGGLERIANTPKELAAAAKELVEFAEAALEEERLERERSESQAKALKWQAKLKPLIESERWVEAQELLNHQPAMPHGPPEVVEYAREAKAKVDAHLAERERITIEANGRLNDAQSSIQRGRWREALGHLAQLRRLKIKKGDDLLTRAAALEKECHAGLDGEVRRQASELACAYVTQQVRAALPRLLDPALVVTSVSAIEFKAPSMNDAEGVADAPISGRATLTAAISDRGEGAAGGPEERGSGAAGGEFTAPFAFRVGPNEAAVTNAEDLSEGLRRHLGEAIATLRKSRLKKLGATLCRDLFPQARLKTTEETVDTQATLRDAAEGRGPAGGHRVSRETRSGETPAQEGVSAGEAPADVDGETTMSISPLKGSDQRISIRVRWKPASLSWEAIGLEEAARAAVDVVAGVATKVLPPALAAGGGLLARLAPATRVEVQVAPEAAVAGPGAASGGGSLLAIPVPLRVRAVWQTPGDTSRRAGTRSGEPEKPLAWVPLPARNIEADAIEADTARAATQVNETLARALAEAQEQARVACVQEVQRRLTAAGPQGGSVTVSTTPAARPGPVETASLELKPRRGRAKSLSLTWDEHALAWELPAEASAVIEALAGKAKVATLDTRPTLRVAAEDRGPAGADAPPQEDKNAEAADDADLSRRAGTPSDGRRDADIAGAAASGAAAADAGGGGGGRRGLVIVAALLGVAAIGGGALYFLRSPTPKVNGDNGKIVTPVTPVTPKKGIVSAVDLVQVASGQVGFKYHVGGEAIPPPFKIQFFWDTNKNNLLDAGDERVGDEVEGDVTPGDHVEHRSIDPEKSGTLVASISAPPGAGEPPRNPAELFRKRDIVGTPVKHTVTPVNIRELVLKERGGLDGARPPRDLAAVLSALFPKSTPQTDALKVRLASMAEKPSWKTPLRAVDADHAEVVIGLEVLGNAGSIASEPFRFKRGPESSVVPDGDHAKILSNLAAAAKARLMEKVDAAGKAIIGAPAAGRPLKAACDALAGVQSILGIPEVASSKTAADIANAARKLPPCWTGSGWAGMAAPREVAPEGTQTHPLLGYPMTLVHGASRRTLRLVAVPASDPVWQAIEAKTEFTSPRLLEEVQALRADWVIFYVETGSQATPVNTVEEARAAAVGVGCRIPTRGEWALACLSLLDGGRSDALSGITGDRFVWCGPTGEGWVSGGCAIMLGGKAQHVPPIGHSQGRAPGKGDIWEWLNNPLVTQPRAFGDGLATSRMLFSIMPRERAGAGPS